ncbi:transcriptional regulator-like protein [Deinococcus sp. Arct2-2]|uniref:type IV toxin-antitoxin system AbiEi family antitoxin domain-containing protein n=1 Tax=Deinococcus sp. Arct2-2 TaxID=2568653 RepID=UPI0010A4C288|nr:type IV toxin-antitoxin system AbiEi family antitoxin domain-containing protein [Deinococcus sp. Arct2-2]THF68020.1 transcriptional regulator-like protein [Deinococcus sp. Arct2-2]
MQINANQERQSPETRLRALFAQRGGYLTTHEAQAKGIAGVHLSRLAAAGEIERVQRGVYRHPQASQWLQTSMTVEQLLEVQLRVPYARPSLLSALELHGLTTTTPSVVYVTIPANRHFPPLSSPPIQVIYAAPHVYEYGVETVQVNGRQLLTYSAAKTLADLLKHSPRYGRHLYLEGLKKYLDRRGDLHALMDAAKVMKVESGMRHDLEVLAHDQDH